MTAGSILIIDDDKDVLEALAALLEDEFDQIVTETNPARLPTLLHQSWDVVLLDMNFSAGINSGNEGLYWLAEILKKHPAASVVTMTAYGKIDLAVEAIKRGAKDFVLKPWDNEKLLATVMACVRTKKSPKRGHETTEGTIVSLIGRSAAMDELNENIRKVASTDASVLILGENGTGKEVVANEIHRLSGRAYGVFVSVDMAALPEKLFESELFGHRKGAFTDAKSDRKGRFESANGGTLFLDEIGNLPLHQQAKLLTVLQRRAVTAIGSNTEVPIDVRLISATNAPITEMAEAGKFRQDLLYRINTITLRVPPLRLRGEDIIYLAEHFLATYGVRYSRQGIYLGDDARSALLNYQWPGNVRELQHTMEKVVILSSEERISASDLNLFTSGIQPGSHVQKTLDEIEKDALVSALKAHSGNILQAARSLGITRQTFYNKMKKYGI